MPIRVHTDADHPGPPTEEATRASAGRRLPNIADQLVDSVRRVLFAFGRSAPRTVIDGPACVRLDAAAGTTATTTVSVGNHQAAACVVIPALSCLTGAAGERWAPVHRVDVGQRLLLAGDRTEVGLAITIDDALPTGTYRGELVLLGVDGTLPIEIVVSRGDPS